METENEKKKIDKNHSDGRKTKAYLDVTIIENSFNVLVL